MGTRRAPIVAELAEGIDASALAEAIAFNEMAGRLYVRGVLPWSDGGRPENRPWDSRDDSHGYAWAQEELGCGGERDFQHALTIVGDGRRYNPVTDMLEALPSWDGGGRVGYLMQSFLGAEDGDYVSEVERLFMRAAITRAYRPGCKFDYMPVLVGPQGAGKSTFLRMLAMDDSLFTDSVSGIGTKQAAELVQGKWIVEVAELAAMRGAALESVKAFITRQSDDYRAPYARHAESRPRRFVVAGTTNSQGFLVDATGNRRFLPVRCGSQEPLFDLFDSGAVGALSRKARPEFAAVSTIRLGFAIAQAEIAAHAGDPPRPSTERKTMTEQLCRLDIRISPQDKALLKRRCDEFDMTQTDYMRMLINLPLRMVDEGMEEESDLFVIDRWGAGRIAGQIRRLGYHYNQGIHALNAIAYYLKRDEADSLDALDALEHATGKLEAVDAGVQAIREQLNSLVGKRFGYELFKPNKYENPHNMQERRRQNEDAEASR